MNSALDQLLAPFMALPVEERNKAYEAAKSYNGGLRWKPNPGPQTEAYFCAADVLLYGGQGGGGKALSLDTPLPTPAGWVTMGDVRPGDVLFDERGQPCRVVATSAVMTGHRCYRVRFSDGAEIVADADHRWLTLTAKDRDRLLRMSPEWRARRRATRARRGTGKRPDLAASNAARVCVPDPVTGAVRTTAELAASLMDGRQFNHSIAVCGALICDSAELPVDPYVLGVWLGDGTTASAAITSDDTEIVEAVAAAGYGISYRPYSPITYGVTGGLQVALRRIGVLGNKHIPAVYLRADPEQRLALLQGLMDTDGYCDRRGQCEFTTTRKVLADGVVEVIRSLGVKAAVTEGWATLGGRRISRKYRIKFLTALPAFRLARKLIRQKRGGFRGTHERRYITAVDLVDSVPVKCVAVDSPSRLYLAGAAMIPTHNTDLLLGLAMTAHINSLIMRRRYVDLGGVTKRAIQVNGTRQGFNGSVPPKLAMADRLIEFGAAANLGDEESWQGRPHDLLGLDEVVQFLELQVRFLMGWVRAAEEELGKPSTQRCRAVFASNPPVTAEGQWIIGMFRPWLDVTHHNPAGPGELRWFLTDPDGKDLEVAGADDCRQWGGKIYRPKSRTFIPAALSDNPFLINTGYQATLDSLPEPLRSAVRDGNFMAARRDAPDQVIPASWVIAAQERWTPRPPSGIPMCAMGVDASGGGDDPMIIAPRHDGWYAPLIEIPGKDIPPDRVGKFCAGIVVSHRRDGATVVIDMGGGYGGPMYEHLKDNQVPVVAHKGAEKATKRTSDRKLGFTNKRSEIIWRFREALDPERPGGSPIALPNDPLLVADLTAPTFEVTPNGIKVEPKDDLVKRLGRSTDRGDAVCMSWSAGASMLTHGSAWGLYGAEDAPRNRPNRPGQINVIHGHERQRRKR